MKRLPTSEEFQELINKCKWVWKDNGYAITGPNGNSIFLPAEGYKMNDKCYGNGNYGYYWTSESSGNNVVAYLFFNQIGYHVSKCETNKERTVRLVGDEPNQVNLGLSIRWSSFNELISDCKIHCTFDKAIKLFNKMEENKHMKIEIPNGYEIDKERSTFEDIVFKKKDTKPRSWKEYGEIYSYENFDGQVWMPESMEEQVRAFVRLLCLRKAWIGKWEPNWRTGDIKYCIEENNGSAVVETYYKIHRPLSFPTSEMAKDFLDTFKDLIEEAKDLC